MRTAKVYLASRLSCMPNQQVGTHPVIKIVTDLPANTKNSFYIDPSDLQGNSLVIATDHAPTKGPVNSMEMNEGDPIEFDVQDGVHKSVIWNGRTFRQRGYSFDEYKNYTLNN